MKIAVCVKQVVAREWHVRIDETGTWIRDEDASWTLNEPDGYALEEALRLRDRDGGEVTAIAAGAERVTHVVRDALARGADHGVHVDIGDAPADAFATASALASAMAGERFDLILTGLQSDDHGFGQVGVILAELLGVAHATLVTELHLDGQALRVKRELEGGWFQWIGMRLPAVLTMQSGINQLRYTTLKGIMAAKRKEIRRVAPAVAPGSSRQRIVSLYVPDSARRARLIDGEPGGAAVQLVRLLRDEARAID